MKTKTFPSQSKASASEAGFVTKTGRRSSFKSASEPPSRAYLPEFVPLKSVGGDPVTGMSRSWWYSAERDGLIKLVRIRRPGMVKARVLLPVSQALELIRRLSSTVAVPTVFNGESVEALSASHAVEIAQIARRNDLSDHQKVRLKNEAVNKYISALNHFSSRENA